MLNLKKISQAMLIAFSLAVASFYIAPSYAADKLSVDDNYLNAKKTSKKTGKTNASASSADTVSQNTYQQSTVDMKARSADAENAATEKQNALNDYNNYTKSAEYTNAKAQYNRLEQQRKDNIKKAEDARESHKKEVERVESEKIIQAQNAYNSCKEKGGACSDLYMKVKDAEKAKTQAVKDAENDKELNDAIEKARAGSEEYAAASEAWANMEATAATKQQNVATAEQKEKNANAQKKAAQQAGVSAATASIEAQNKKIDQAKQDKAKAERDRDNAAADVEKKCGKDPNSRACKKAKEKMDEASARVGAANQSMNEANEAKATAQQNIADLTAEDRQNAEKARIAAEEKARQEAEDAEIAAADAEAARQIEEETKRQKAAQDRSDAQDAANTANNKYNGAVNNYKDAANNLAKVQAQCQGNTSQECKDKIAAAQKALDDAKMAADQAYKDKDAADKKLKDLGPDPESLEVKKANLATASKNRNQSEQNLADLQDQYAQAKAACEYSKKLTSKQGQAEAEKYCAEAGQLAAAIAEEEENLKELKRLEQDAKDDLSLAEDHSNQEYMAFEGDNSGVNYTNADDVLQTITRRAAYILVGLKPIVYTFAGFGLIAFAYMAIFNKISWKWFGNIAIGLFLVANMGRLIEYAIFPTDDDGKINDGKLDSFGDYLQNALNDTEYVWVDPITPYTPPTILEKQGADKPDETVEAKEEKPDNPLRKFCGKTDGATGWGNFSNCVKDVVSAGKKAVAAAQKVQNTVNTVTNAVNGSMNAVTNIVGAAKSIGKGNLEDSVRALGRIGQNVNSIVGITGGAVGQIMNNATGIRNDMQDVTKSIDEQRELQARRDRGEATNKFNAKYMGQVLDENGEVERLWGGMDKDGNVIAGDIASNRGYGIMRDHNGNIITKKNDKGEDEVVYGFKTPNQPGFMDGIQNVVKTSNDINNQYQNAVNVTSDAIGVIGNAGIGAMRGLNGQKFYDGSQTINDHYTKKQQEKQQEKQAQQSAVKNLVASIADSGMTVTDVTKQAAQDAVDYNKLKSEALSAASTAKSLNNAAIVAQKNAEAAAAKCAATQMKSDCMRAAQAKAESEKAARKAQDAQEIAAEVGAKASAAEKAAHESAVSATAEARDSAETAMKDKQKALDAAKQALKDAQDKGDADAIKAAKQVLNQRQDAYDKAESAYFQAAVKYEELTEDKEERKSIEQALSKDYKNMDSVQSAKKAENEYKQAKNNAITAENDAKRLSDVAKDAQKKADAAASKCMITKMASDCNAASLSKLEADQAARKAQEAKETAIEAAAKASETEKAAHESAVSAAAEVSAKAKKDMDNASQKVDAAKEALSEAQKSGDADAIKKAKEFLSTQQDAYVSVAKAYYKASEAHATLVEDVDSRKTADNAYAEVARQALAQQETEDARRNYMENNTPDKIAQAAKEQLNKAQNEAAKAAAYAKEREQVAKKAADLAKNAAEKAKDSGNPADLAKAEELQKRADLAKAEADSANVAAAEAQKPIADLQQKSTAAQVKKLETDQAKYKQAIETAETEMKNARSKIADAQAKAKTLLDQVEKLAQAAEKDPNNDDAVMAASQAYKVYQSAQQEINKLQKELDETIRQKSAAENSYFSTVSQLENLTK